MPTVVAGIDVSKSQLDVHVAGDDRQFANQRHGYRALGAWLQGHRATRVVLESTGRYHRAVHQSLHAQGLEVVLVNPLRTRRFAEALGQLAKTDTIDAAALAAYGTACLDLPATPPRPAFLERLADLLVLREQHREAQASLRLSAMEMQDPGLREEGLRSVDLLGRQIDGGIYTWLNGEKQSVRGCHGETGPQGDLASRTLCHVPRRGCCRAVVHRDALAGR